MFFERPDTFGLYPHQEEIMARLSENKIGISLDEARAFAEKHNIELAAEFERDSAFANAFQLLMDFEPNTGKTKVSDILSQANRLHVKRMAPNQTWDATDPDQVSDFFAQAMNRITTRGYYDSELSVGDDIQLKMIDEAHMENSYSFDIPDRNSIPVSSGIHGNHLSWDQVYQPTIRPEIDLQKQIRKAMPIPMTQLLLEDNSVLREFLEEYNEQQEFKAMTVCPSHHVIDALTEDLEAIDYKSLHSQVDGISQEHFHTTSVVCKEEERRERLRHNKSTRKAAKQRAKRKGK